ncbi:MAG TPA: methyltransferase domain-containing protein [Bryobacteraceae bacterium]|nr:methyltransferase domain-containing protein [Bryobacteraceae bacterium]
MSDRARVEFTGERVIPGQVNDDLWSEHVARYAFARRYADGLRVLDAGCGTGYGAAELAQSAAEVVGVDVAPEAIEYAQASYPLPTVRFVMSSCTSVPFPQNSFELVVAFEVIEHLPDFRAFLNECGRVITPQGLFIVSSPNKRYYADSRAKEGPNPYHQHEFEPSEFVAELRRVFSNVRLLLQNRVESFAFHPASSFWPAEARIDGGGGSADDANFLIGMCSFGPLPEARSFVYVPKAANLLREREQHVQLLETQLARTKQWLADTQAERDTLLNFHRQLNEDLESRNRWAEKLTLELGEKGERVVALQNELVAQQQAGAAAVARYQAKVADLEEENRARVAGYEGKITELEKENRATVAAYEGKVAELEEENRARTEWAIATEARLSKELEDQRRDLEAQGRDLEARCRELAECVRLLDTAEATVTERTQWAQRAEAQRQELAAQLNLVRASRWLKLGRKLGLGPDVNQP